MNKYPDLGKRLQMFREKNKYTQQEMASACGLSKNHISALERGCSQCSAGTLIGYAEKLNMSLDELAGLPAPKSAVLPELEGMLARMTAEEQQSVLNSLRDHAYSRRHILPELQELLYGMSPQEQKKTADIIRLISRPADR